MTQAPPMTGQDIGMAAKATRALLDILLDRERVSFPEWVALRALGGGRAPIERDALRQDLAGLLGQEPEAITGLLAGLEARRLVREAPTEHGVGVEPTAEGLAVFGRLTAGVAGVATQVYGDLDPDDLAATRRVLAEVTDRARELRTRL